MVHILDTGFGNASACSEGIHGCPNSEDRKTLNHANDLYLLLFNKIP